MTLLATTLPENSNDGYVAAAYIVFFALVLVYVAIMAIRLSRVERSVRDLRTRERESTESAPREQELEADRTLTGTPRGGEHASEIV
ncbi:MAG: hypothetical protein ACRDJ3_08505 [Solirubrobacteraceae bacterium]